MRSRRAKLILIGAVVAALGAAAPFAPDALWGVRIAWHRHRLDSADADARWAARLALLRMPPERAGHLRPQVVASVLAERAREGQTIFEIRDGQFVPVFPASADATLRPSDARVLKFSDDPASTVLDLLAADAGDHRLVSVSSPFWSIDVRAPLDDEGETLRLLRERLAR